jgi:trk system potassium uptake protein TrkH
MNYRVVLYLLGRLQLALAVALVVPGVVSWILDGPVAGVFFVSAAIAGAIGITAEVAFRRSVQHAFGRREAFLLVTAAWVTASVVGAVPYVLFKGPGFIVNALFESASGFTTTGASILVDLESEPAGLLLWRSLTQWMGGMGIIVLGIAILPKLAVGGMQLLGAEAPGPITEKLTPRIAQTAKALWGIYALLTGAEAAALILLGMGPLDAFNHALATMATGGFSTRAASVGAFGSAAIEMVVTLFMVLAGVNFALHFKLLRGRPLQVLRDSELRLYLFVLLAATVCVSGDLLRSGLQSDWLSALRLGAFQVTTIVTTTGFATADFDAWPAFSRALLFALMFVGGCAGSTGGSVKVVRAMIVCKKLFVDLRCMVQPNAVLPVRVGRRAIPDEVVTSVTTFLIMFVTLFAAGGLLLALLGLDLVTAYSASAACLGNIGPGFGLVGPTATYAPLPAPAKLVLVGMMIIGRLELYTVLVTLFLFYRRVRTSV